jgi:hypothetical protein
MVKKAISFGIRCVKTTTKTNAYGVERHARLFETKWGIVNMMSSSSMVVMSLWLH